MEKHKTFSISDLAAEFDITTRAIRFYEEKALLAPLRNGSNRIYSVADRVKLRLILRGKRLGLTLEESRDIIDMYDPAHGNVEQLTKLINRFRDKRQQLEEQLDDLQAMMLDLHDAEQKCLQALSKAEPKSKTDSLEIEKSTEPFLHSL
ncbi:MAG: DNA-binding transcriptional MerR regulator [Oceanicoccus sp.]|jgi:DNA-binding transcriptional MerR regulator